MKPVGFPREQTSSNYFPLPRSCFTLENFPPESRALLCVPPGRSGSSDVVECQLPANGGSVSQGGAFGTSGDDPSAKYAKIQTSRIVPSHNQRFFP